MLDTIVRCYTVLCLDRIRVMQLRDVVIYYRSL
jgi:hypothetical protein